MTNLADKIDALAEKATLGCQLSYDGPANNLIVWEDCDNRVCFMAHSDGADTERDVSRAALIVELVNARETLTRALRDAERMREALGSVRGLLTIIEATTEDEQEKRAAIEGVAEIDAALGDNT